MVQAFDKACDEFKSQQISRNIKMCQYLWWFVKILKDLSRSAEICWDLPRSAKICWDLLKSFKIYWNMWRSEKIWQDLMGSVKYAMTHLLRCGWCPRKGVVDGNGDVYRWGGSERVKAFIYNLQRKLSLQDIWKRFVKHLKKIYKRFVKDLKCTHLKYAVRRSQVFQNSSPKC